MKRFTAKQVNESPNEVYNEATKSPVLIDHKRRGAEFVMMSKLDYVALRDGWDKREGKDE